ncbi:hypothetical protein NP493_435g00001 [Ridgeia piscesae]|uniref:Autophagy-related protein 2 n=1 Tax=Ridgeia piscesae TaxID=27915 RepID=A0AAD9L130_RIDPI|nr:hypothetical protein NP493_435g00001 [Ridgeia piscesae]
MEFFNVIEYPVLGYTPPKILTEMHTHLWGCAVDYRPLSLPYRAVLTVETFSISSNIIAESPTSLLRFLIDDAALYISDKCDAKEVDLRKNYVCVVDIGMFELSLRTSDGRDVKYPKLDLRASNNIVHIRTCADSCRALALLLNYLATDGDLATTPRSESETKLKTMASSSSSLSDSPHVSQTHLDHVHSLMADAMKESNSSDSDTDSTDASHNPESLAPTELFFFPDEQQSTADRTVTRSETTRPVVTTTEKGWRPSLDREPSDDIAEYSGDDEYCIIDSPGMGVMSRDGEPRIRVLTSDPIAVMDNHFHMPLGQTDQLRSPDNFPGAILRYTLREMSLVWYMYGGHDFESSSKKGRFTKGVEVRVIRSGYKPAGHIGKVGWQARGGPQRDIDVLVEFQLNKIRVQHEVFPDNTEQASRQILLISEVEIRDRLTSSKINKFLYQFTSDALPRQSHANMLVVKLTHVRPDPTQTAQECSLKVSLQPLRLNVDQDALFFLRSFFLGISGDESKTEQAATVNPTVASPGAAVRPPGVHPPTLLHPSPCHVARTGACVGRHRPGAVCEVR